MLKKYSVRGLFALAIAVGLVAYAFLVPASPTVRVGDDHISINVGTLRVQAVAEAPIPSPPPLQASPAPALEFYKNYTTTESSTSTLDVYATHLTLQVDRSGKAGSKDFFVIGTLVVTTNQYQGARLYQDDSITLQEPANNGPTPFYDDRFTQGWTYGFFRKVTLDNSSHNFKLQFKLDSGTGTVYANLGSLICLEVSANAEYAEQIAEISSDSDTVWKDVVELSFTATAEDYLILGAGEFNYMDESDAYPMIRVRHKTDSVDYLFDNEANFITSANDNNPWSMGFAVYDTLAAGTNAFAYQFLGASPDHIKAQRVCIAAIPFSDFENVYEASKSAKEWHQGTSYSDCTGVSVSPTVNAADHLVLSSLEISNETGSSATSGWRMVADGVNLTSSCFHDRDEDFDEYYLQSCFYGATLASGTRTFKIQATSSSTSVNYEACVRKAYILVLEIPAVPPDQVPPAPTVDDFIPFEFKQSDNLTPSFRFQSNDPDGSDSLHYQIQIDDDHGFGSTFFDHNSDTNPSYFQNIDSPLDTPPFNEAETIQYDPPSSLTDSTTWYWRVRAKETDTSYGAWNYVSGSYHWSISTLDSLADPRWFQTADEQFDTGTSANVTIAGDNVTLIGGAGIVQEDLETNSITSGTSLDVSGVTVTGTNRGLLVFVTQNAGSVGVRATVNWKSGGSEQAFGSAIGYAENSDDAITECFFLVAPTTGTDTVYVTFSSSVSNGAVAGVISLSGVHQSTSYGVVQEATGDSADPTDTCPTATGEVVYGACASEYGTLVSDDPTQEIWDVAPATHDSIGSKDTDASSVTFDYSTGDAGSHWAIVCLSMKPSGGASTGSLISREIDYDWLSGATDWGYFYFTDVEGTGDIKYDIQYWSGGWVDTPLVNIDTSPQDISSLVPATHNRIRIKAKFTDSGNPSLTDWTLSWTTVGVPDISVAPASHNFGVVSVNSTPSTSTTFFTITNSSTMQTDQTIAVTTNTWSGGVTWTHSDTATPGTDQAGLLSNRGGTWGVGDVIVKFTSPNYIYENCPASTNYDFGLKLIAPTLHTDGVQKQIIVRIEAVAG